MRVFNGYIYAYMNRMGVVGSSWCFLAAVWGTLEQFGHYWAGLAGPTTSITTRKKCQLLPPAPPPSILPLPGKRFPIQRLELSN